VIRRWLLACTAAEAVGMTAAAAAARGATDLEGRAPAMLGLALVVLGGLLEGAALGTFQSWALADLLGRRGRARWLVGTVLVAGLGWAAASAPATLSSAASGDAGPASGNGSEPPLLLVLVGAALLGAVMGAVLGAVQSWALRGRVRHPRRWVVGSVASWGAAMPVIFLGATVVPAAWPAGTVVVVGTATGLVAGLVLGAVGAAFLLTLDGPSLRHRLVLTVLGTRLVHPADRDGDGALIGLGVTGSRTGRVFRFPVSAARPDPGRLVVLPGHPERKTWWRNLDRAAALDVLVDGAWRPATGRVLRCGDPAWDVARSAYAARFPATRFSGQPLVVIDLTPGWDQSPRPSGRSAVGAVFLHP